MFEPLEFLERLAAMTPRPETNLLICHGVLAPRARVARARGLVRPRVRLDLGASHAPGVCCGIGLLRRSGSCGVPRPSLADYVRGLVAIRAATAAATCQCFLRSGVRLENDLSTLLRTTEDRVEGAKAFVVKRKPKWTGR